MKKIDLHVHTIASDGTLTPPECVHRAKELDLSAIAITDHDTADGVAAACAEGEKCGVEVIPGIEISADYLGIEGVHILGYFIDPNSPALNELLDWVIQERDARNEKIAAAMRADGIDVDLDEMRDKYATPVIGRPHFAAQLVEKKIAQSISDAFDRYLGEEKIYYRRREYIPMDRAFSVIERAGGKAVLAHPLQYEFSEEQLISLITTVRGYGAVGMECLYSQYSEQQSEYLMSLAQHFGMCVTGGSDYHGSRKPDIEIGFGKGELNVPYELLEKLKMA